MILKYKLSNIIFFIFKAYFILLIIIVGGMIWTGFENYWVVAFSIMYLINVLPGLYLHMQYYNANRGLEYIINSDNIIVKDLNTIETILVSDIEKIRVHMCANKYVKSSITYMAHEHYYFARIYTKRGKSYFITSLLTEKIEEALLPIKDNVIYEREQTFFCTLSSE